MGSKLENYGKIRDDGIKLKEQNNQKALEKTNEAVNSEVHVKSVQRLDEEDDKIVEQAMSNARAVGETISKEIETAGTEIRNNVEPSALEAGKDSETQVKNSSEVSGMKGDYSEIGQTASSAFAEMAAKYNEMKQQLSQVGETAESEAKSHAEQIRGVWG